MEEIYKQYGSTLITVGSVVAIIVVILAVIGTDATGIVGKAFHDLLTQFLSNANAAAGLTP